MCVIFPFALRAAHFGAISVETVTQGGASLALGSHRNGPLGLSIRLLNLTPMGGEPVYVCERHPAGVSEQHYWF